MSRNILSWDDATKDSMDKRRQASNDTQSRIFGFPDEDYSKTMAEKKKQLIQAEKEKVLAMSEAIEQKEKEAKRAAEMLVLEKKIQNEMNFFENFQPQQASQQAEKVEHTIRYTSFMDENMSNDNRIRSQKLQQKQWLDQQMAERKSLDRKTKKSDDIKQESFSKQSAVESSQIDRSKLQKQEMQNNIREYNEVMAAQKRAKDKKAKEMDKQDYGNLEQQKAIKEELKKGEAQRQRLEEEMIEKERALSRDMRQMNTKN